MQQSLLPHNISNFSFIRAKLWKEVWWRESHHGQSNAQRFCSCLRCGVQTNMQQSFVKLQPLWYMTHHSTTKQLGLKLRNQGGVFMAQWHSWSSHMSWPNLVVFSFGYTNFCINSSVRTSCMCFTVPPHSQRKMGQAKCCKALYSRDLDSIETPNCNCKFEHGRISKERRPCSLHKGPRKWIKRWPLYSNMQISTLSHSVWKDTMFICQVGLQSTSWIATGGKATHGVCICWNMCKLLKRRQPGFTKLFLTHSFTL